MIEAKIRAEADAKAKAVALPIAAATKEKPWENSLGMRFVPVAGTEVLFSVWETRVQDYAAFAQAQGGVDSQWRNPGFTQANTHPVVKVNWDDAQMFARWLTDKERREGKIPAAASYRLPQDWEWSVAVDLDEPRSGTPQDKDERILGVYPWGTQWPPPRGAGNYEQWLRVDDYEYTSPVGSFAENRFGLNDMGGNVYQWCEDFYNGTSGNGFLRGSSWKTFYLPRHLLSSNRYSIEHGYRSDTFGFRCVLVGVDGVR
ncbi:hypothetical protein LBMAG56_53010 [Verrucomicrobiota bacterium]|nr:hypothetical protein LBMAG56_53010 [Verrucomicrobiota bacterium]